MLADHSVVSWIDHERAQSSPEEDAPLDFVGLPAAGADGRLNAPAPGEIPGLRKQGWSLRSSEFREELGQK
jgi:hypothetical protein